jgi:hypothetical protein
MTQSQAVAGRAGASSPVEAGVLLTATSPARPQGAVRAGRRDGLVTPGRGLPSQRAWAAAAVSYPDHRCGGSREGEA